MKNSLKDGMLDPNKRTNYTFGMIMGVDDFRQEQEHFLWKHCISNRLLHGYGTVCGLRVSKRPLSDGSDVEISIAQGYAISPRGKWIWVTRDQCARLGKWLQKAQSGQNIVLNPGQHTVYVKLCYAECEVDLKPIAGEPCSSGESTRAASRIQEAFRVEFSWTPPEQEAEEHVRALGELLSRVEIVSEQLTSPPIPDDSASLLDRVRNLSPFTSPPTSPLTSPPGEETFSLYESTAGETIRQALTLWTTEVCPRFEPSEAGKDDCILLACIRFEADTDGSLKPATVEIDNCARPVLISDRVKQELLCITGYWEDTGPAGLIRPQIGRRTPLASADLTRIVALSWPHGRNSLLDIKLDRRNTKGLIIAFGKRGIEDLGTVQARSVNTNTFQVFCEQQGEDGLWTRKRVQPVTIVPVRPALDALGRVTVARRLPPGEPAKGAAFLISEDQFETLVGRKLIVAVKGDFITDETGERAIDAEHIRGQLPTGNRFGRNFVGLEGGLFESWVRVLGEFVDINMASATDLRTLPRIGPVLAKRIVEKREELGRFSAVEDLLSVEGIGEDILNAIRPFISIGE